MTDGYFLLLHICCARRFLHLHAATIFCCILYSTSDRKQLSDLGTGISILIAVVSLGVAFVTYRAQRGRARLQYVAVADRALISSTRFPIDVSVAGRQLNAPRLVVLRMVNTGDKPISREDFQTNLRFRLHDVEVVSVLVTGAYPSDIAPVVLLEKDSAVVEPLLLNVGDSIELQLICDGEADVLSVEGRIAGVSAIERRSLPYAPGSGGGGAMLGSDKFMWAVPPIVIYALLLYSGVTSLDGVAVKVAAVLAETAFFGVLYPVWIWSLVRTSRLWRTPEQRLTF